MIGSVLIANRGEIACRVIRTARRMGIRTIAVYSEADAGALHVREADAAVAIGPAPARESYLVAEKIIAAAKQSGAEAIHPGYGFLSENEVFAMNVIEAGLVWVGPRPVSIRAMGLKDAAKKLMANAGVPVTPGHLGEDQSAARLADEAAKIGFPVLIKAVAGGGGKGMRKVERASDFADALGAAKREAKASFGDDRVLLETYVQRPRHIEVQVFGDAHGNVVHLFERDCSLQRRHQKVIEEAPAPGMNEETREAVCAAAVRAAKAVSYQGAGTVEFIADASDGLRPDRIWFMEMNTRLQVEHPVTEEVTGVDLVEWQFRVASGEALPLTQDKIKLRNHAMEVRLYAENPAVGFLPSTGRLDVLNFPRAVRVEAAVEGGDIVTPHYDPMIAKLIAVGRKRGEAIDLLRRACEEVEVYPVKTNAGFLVRCLNDQAFQRGDVDTGLIAERGEKLTAKRAPSESAVAQAAGRFIGLSAEYGSGPWARLGGFRLNAPASSKLWMRLDGALIAHDISAPVTPLKQGEWINDVIIGDTVIVFEKGEAYAFTPGLGAGDDAEAAAGDGAIRSPMPGKIVSVAAKNGAAVKKGDPIVTLEAMKMEHVLTAPFDGVVSGLSAQAGDQVSEGVVLARLEKAPH